VAVALSLAELFWVGCSAAGSGGSVAGAAGGGQAGVGGSGSGFGGAAGGGGFNLGDASHEGSGEKGCEKADFLFVIDNSGSMGAHQQNLTRSFPGFIQTIQSTLKGQDYHIMVVDTDAADICDGTCAGGASFCANASGASCSSLGVAMGCDATLGAGRTFGAAKFGQPCPKLDGGRYMTQNQANLPDAFACIAKVGTYGQGNEQPMAALLAAVGTGPAGTCNTDFLRRDAILVVTVVTDAPPQTAAEQVMGQPQSWFQSLVAAKAGNQAAISVLGLVSDGDLPGGLCSTEAGDARHGAPKLRDWVGLFTHNVLASVCEPDYSQFFASAVKEIDESCDEFIKPPR